MMYEELIKNLRHDSVSALQNCEFDFVHDWMLKAADAIEELSERVPSVPHGRLVDADVLDKVFSFIAEAEAQIYGRGSWRFTGKCRDALADAPTVIEAERGE